VSTIASCILGLSATTRDGLPAQDATPDFWREQLRAVADQGFDSVEINDAWLKPTLMSADRRAALVEAAKDVGLDIVALHIQRVSPIAPGAADDNLAYGHASIDAAAEMGVQVYSTGLHQPFTDAQRAALWFWTAQGPVDPVDDPDVWAEAVSRIRELGRHAAEVGLPLSLELYEDTYLGTADSAVRFVEEVGLDNVGLNPDVGNLIRLHRPVEDWRELYAKTLPYANYWHLKNYQRDESPDRAWAVAFPATMRDGIINYREVVAHAREIGYGGIFTCEHYGGDSLGVCGENRRYLQTLLV
jgi:sugar phosphate isomerase/epimerase